ncbi:MAG TPA: MFS transporter [Terriglobales bacterium]|jgi:MFS family permease|nr:MFS transporter [Terriglobales bacterium]
MKSAGKIYPAIALAVLTGLNFFNYVDRSVLSAVQPLIQKEFHRSDADMGWLTSVFFFCYMLTSPVIGVLADRYPRKWLVAAGAMVWSGATLLTAVTHDYQSLLVRHTIVGIGEGSFVVIAPSLVSDLFPEHQRGRMLAILNSALPAGSAAGYVLGGYLGPLHGWRSPFYVAALPGFLLALMIMLIPEPQRGHADRLFATPERATLLGLTRNPAYWTASLGQAMYIFAIGGLAVWMPTFLSRVRSIPLSDANRVFGEITLFDGVVATLAGGWLADWLLRRNKAAYYHVSAWSMLLAIPFMAVAIFRAGALMYPAMLLAVFFLLANTGPLNAAVVNSVAAPIRSTALALNLFIIHILGDVPSPPLMGFISDHSSLSIAFVPAMVACLFSGVILFYGTRFAPSVPITEEAIAAKADFSGTKSI